VAPRADEENGLHSVPRLAMPVMLWVAGTKPGKDAGSPDSCHYRGD
jgi:hypothetical protein